MRQALVGITLFAGLSAGCILIVDDAQTTGAGGGGQVSSSASIATGSGGSGGGSSTCEAYRAPTVINLALRSERSVLGIAAGFDGTVVVAHQTVMEGEVRRYDSANARQLGPVTPLGDVQVFGGLVATDSTSGLGSWSMTGDPSGSIHSFDAADAISQNIPGVGPLIRTEQGTLMAALLNDQGGYTVSEYALDSGGIPGNTSFLWSATGKPARLLHRAGKAASMADGGCVTTSSGECPLRIPRTVDMTLNEQGDPLVLRSIDGEYQLVSTANQPLFPLTMGAADKVTSLGSAYLVVGQPTDVGSQDLDLELHLHCGDGSNAGKATVPLSAGESVIDLIPGSVPNTAILWTLDETPTHQVRVLSFTTL